MGGAFEMADITMCTQTLCPNAGHCYRVQAKAGFWQSMATFEYSISERGVECSNYLPMFRVTQSLGSPLVAKEMWTKPDRIFKTTK
jgi:hypothetical protein